MSAVSSSTTCGSSIVQQLGFGIVLLSFLVSGQAAPRPLLGSGSSLPTQLLFNELLDSAGNEDNTYQGEQMKYQQAQQQKHNFANKWPSLRDLLFTVDYDDMLQSAESKEREQLSNSRLLARLHKLSENAVAGGEELRSNTVDDFTGMPSKKFSDMKFSSSVKEHNTKKNVQFRKQYMSPCHFKICNMGRKRNAGSFNPY